MRFPEKKKEKAYIPTASMADIAFLLIVFFMVTTIFRVEKPRKITLPQAETTERLPRGTPFARVWIEEDGKIFMNDMEVEVQQVRMLMAQKLIDDPKVLVQVKADEDCKYGNIAWVLEELKKARTLKVSLGSNLPKEKR